MSVPTTAPTARAEDRPLLAGGGLFVGDVRRPGQLWLAVVRSPVAHGRLREVRTADAEQVDGVHRVFTAADLGPGAVPAIPIRVAARPGMDRRLQPVLATDRVRYVGEPVAAVVASDPHVAEDAAELVEPVVDPLDVTLDVLAEAPAPLWDDADDNVLFTIEAAHGDVDAAIAQAAVVVRDEFRVQRHTGLPLETRGLVAEWDEVAGTLHLWGPTKGIHFTRRTVAAFLGLAPERVVCHRVDVGGMFGVRGEFYPEDFLVPWAARAVGRPVVWIEDRREHMTAINHSREQHHRLELAVAADGEFLAVRDRVTMDLGAYARPTGARMGEIVLEALPGPYRWRAVAATSRGVVTNKTPVGPIRAPSAVEATFVRERAIDVAAARLGMDPLALRRRNLLRREEIPYHLPLGADLGEMVYDSGDYAAVADGLFEAIGYAALRTEVERRRAAGEAVGLGVAFFAEHSGMGHAESVGLRLREDGTFLLGTSAAEIGQGVTSMATLVLSRHLGVPAEAVEVEASSSLAHGGGNGTFASRTAIFVGSATRDACELLLAEAREKAAVAWDVRPDRVTLGPDGPACGDAWMHWKELAPIEVVGRHECDEPTIGFGLNLALVRVDRATGGIAVERLAVGYDCGRAIDREAARQQLAGGSAWGLGGALLEELRYDPAGQPLSTTLMDYRLATCAEVPAVEAYVFETAPAPSNPLGVKGVGEAGTVGVAAAVANAAAAALGPAGASLTALPVEPERLRALAAGLDNAPGPKDNR